MNWFEKNGYTEKKSNKKVANKYRYKYYSKIDGNYNLKLKIFFEEHNWKYYIWWQGKVNNKKIYAETNQVDFDGDKEVKMLEFIKSNTDRKFELIKNCLQKQEVNEINH